jgi:murein DD-endopeptidase MepM/ murein hydrolase activator NlpD
LQQQAAGGLNTVQAGDRQNRANQERLNAQIQASQQEISRLQNQLLNAELQNALRTAEIAPGTGAAQIRAYANDPARPDGDLKDQLLIAADIQEQLSQRQIDVTSLQGEIAQAQVDAQQQLKEVSTQVADFYRGIERNAQDVAMSIKESDLDRVMMQARTRLSTNLTGIGNKYFGEFVSGMTELVEQLFEPLKNLLEAQRNRLAANNQFADTAMQAQQLLSGLQPATGAPLAGAAAAAGRTTRFEGIHVTSAVDASGEPGLDYVVADGRRGAEFGAVAAGTVVRTVTDQNWENNMGRGGRNTGRRGYGNQVIVRARDEVTGEFVDMLYAHLDRVAVQVGQQVGVGTVLGTQGRTGSTTGAHVSLDFFAPDSRRTNRAALGMRDRTARELARGAPNFNQAIQQAPAPAPAPAPAQAARPAQAAPQPTGQRYVPRGGTLSRAERVRSDPAGAAAMAGAAQRLGLPVDQFAALMSWESGGSFNPNVMGGDGNDYQGLIQFSPDNQQRYGIRRNQSIAEQMPAIERYLQDRGFQPGQHDIRHAYSAVLAGNAQSVTGTEETPTVLRYAMLHPNFNRAIITNGRNSSCGIAASPEMLPRLRPWPLRLSTPALLALIRGCASDRHRSTKV